MKNQSGQFMRVAAAWAVALWLAPAPGGRAACTIDFEDLAVGAAVTNQYHGVTFSVQPQSCGVGSPLYMRIKPPDYGTTSSGAQCLKIDTGCPDFSPDYLVMVFDLPQTQVSFTLGDLADSYYVRAYTTTSGGTPTTMTVDTVTGVHRLVTVTGSNIRRIEVESVTSGLFETIDDLTFLADATPPIAEISAPAFNACECGDVVTVYGVTCDPDGVYGSDKLEYMPVSGGGWTQVGFYASPACAPNSVLYSWNTTALPDGDYYLRLTTTNKCGLSSEAVTVVSLNHTVKGTALRGPGDGTILGGGVCVDGSAGGYGCFDHYLVERAPAGGGPFVSVDGLSHTSSVRNDPLAFWNTADNTTPDGDYVLRLTAFDTCGHSASEQVAVTVDNTAPTGLISSPAECAKLNGVIQIFGSASDDHLASWSLEYSDPATHHWHPIASGSSPVINGLFASWDTAGLPACAYTLRLRVTDQSRVNLDCSGTASANQTEYLLNLDVVSDPLAQDTDGDGMPDVWENAHGFDPNDPADAALDADNDGQSNLAEYLAGTDPRDPASLLRITAIGRESADTRVTWTTEGSHHYVLEGGTSLAVGIQDEISPLISVPPGGSSTTNYLHLNGATLPERYYRVHLVP